LNKLWVKTAKFGASAPIKASLFGPKLVVFVQFEKGRYLRTLDMANVEHPLRLLGFDLIFGPKLGWPACRHQSALGVWNRSKVRSQVLIFLVNCYLEIELDKNIRLDPHPMALQIKGNECEVKTQINWV
jgi:hypothetical protein